MNLEVGLLSLSIFFGVLSFGLFFTCLKKSKQHRELFEFTGKQIEDLQDALAKNKETFETNAQRIAEQSRRIAWLETRVRHPKSSNEEELDDTAIHETPKLNMTERRHLVISLASRGQNAEMIASALGMLPGEVELIININQASLNHK